MRGFYWDDDAQRYFALSDRRTGIYTQPKPKPSPRPTPQLTDALSIVRPRLYLALSRLRSVSTTVHKDALIHQIRSSQISLTDNTARLTIPIQGLISAFQAVSHSGRVSCFVGDTLGWFYSAVLEESHIVDPWQPQYHLSSQVSSIATSSTICVATSFGPDCKILCVPLDVQAQGGVHLSRINSRIVHDVWTTDLLGSRLVLGANKQAVVIEDIALDNSLRRLATQSDVFALAQHEDLLYTGLRNGGIIRFDTRSHKPQCHLPFDNMSSCPTSVTGLKHLRDQQLLVAFLDGSISTFDLRFPVRTPLMNFTGNFNSYTTRLPLITDPYEKFMFAAGQDNRVRLWSLTTGGAPLSPNGSGSTHQNAFERPFEHRVAALQVLEERQGLCLWAASGTELCKYGLGRRSQIEI